VLGIGSCVVLATQIEAQVWLRGLAILAVAAALGALTAVRRNRSAAGDGEARPD
jgi:hypothetical protein